MARAYDEQILSVIGKSNRPLGHRDLFEAIGDGSVTAFGNIGNTLNYLWREGKLEREQINLRWRYTFPKPKAPVAQTVEIDETGTTIRTLREQAELSVEQLSTLSGFASVSIRDIEGGKVRPTLHAVNLLLKALGYRASLTIEEA